MTGTVRVRQAAASTTTTVRTVRTTATTNAASSCRDVQTCRAEPVALLPTPRTATNPRARKTARVLDHLARLASHELERAATFAGARRRHAIEQSRRTLERLPMLVHKAAAKGALGAPAGPIDAAITSLLALDQPG